MKGRVTSAPGVCTVASLVITLTLAAVSPPLHAQHAQDEIVLRRPIPGPVVPPPYFRTALMAGTRSPDGSPGPEYWQSFARYEIDASLDPSTGRVSGRETIRFENRSPDVLPVLVLHVHQNLYAEGAARSAQEEVTGGATIHGLGVEGEALRRRRDPREVGWSLMNGMLFVRLPSPIAPGGSVRMSVQWSFTTPQNGSGRMGHSDREMYFLAYWFPKVAVYDDLLGWDTEPYLGGAEFYDSFADYAVTLTVPQGWTVMATGELENPQDVFTDRVRTRLAAAAHADTMVQVVTRADREAGAVTARTRSGELTYRFRAENVRDFVWTASDRQLWTSTSAAVSDRDGDGEKDRVAIHSFWREERAPLWRDQALYGKHSIEFHSHFTGFTYPWPHMTSVEGDDIIGGGMEFPMLTLIGPYRGRDAQSLYGVTAHELGHMWIPMIVGSDEKRHAWIDEGGTTFLENQSRPDFFTGIHNTDSADAEAYLMVARLELEGILMRHGDFYAPGPGYGIASYQKPATLLVVLRNLLGEETFMEAYRAFIGEWAFKHPTPWDFFNTFERFAGRDLDWFWSSWYYETWTLDHAVAGVEAAEEGPVVTIQDRGFAPMPAMVRIETSRGGAVERQIPVAHWLTGATVYELALPASVGVVTRVELDPEQLFPDVDRSNNVWGGE